MATAASAAMGESTDSSYIDEEQQPSDNVETAANALDGYARSRKKG